jgi:hypothetical protein
VVVVGWLGWLAGLAGWAGLKVGSAFRYLAGIWVEEGF